MALLVRNFLKIFFNNYILGLIYIRDIPDGGQYLFTYIALQLGYMLPIGQ